MLRNASSVIDGMFGSPSGCRMRPSSAGNSSRGVAVFSCRSTALSSLRKAGSRPSASGISPPAPPSSASAPPSAPPSANARTWTPARSPVATSQRRIAAHACLRHHAQRQSAVVAVVVHQRLVHRRAVHQRLYLAQHRQDLSLTPTSRTHVALLRVRERAGAAVLEGRRSVLEHLLAAVEENRLRHRLASGELRLLHRRQLLHAVRVVFKLERRGREAVRRRDRCPSCPSSCRRC